MALPDDCATRIDGMCRRAGAGSNPIDLAGGETRDTIPTALDLICAASRRRRRRLPRPRHPGEPGQRGCAAVRSSRATGSTASSTSTSARTAATPRPRATHRSATASPCWSRPSSCTPTAPTAMPGRWRCARAGASATRARTARCRRAARAGRPCRRPARPTLTPTASSASARAVATRACRPRRAAARFWRCLRAETDPRFVRYPRAAGARLSGLRGRPAAGVAGT